MERRFRAHAKVESISTSWADRAEILTKIDGHSDLLDLQSVITMLKAQRSVGSHQPSIFDTIPCQLVAYLQKGDSHSPQKWPRPGIKELDVEMSLTSAIYPLSDGLGKSSLPKSFA